MHPLSLHHNHLGFPKLGCCAMGKFARKYSHSDLFQRYLAKLNFDVVKEMNNRQHWKEALKQQKEQSI